MNTIKRCTIYAYAYDYALKSYAQVMHMHRMCIKNRCTKRKKRKKSMHNRCNNININIK